MAYKKEPGERSGLTTIPSNATPEQAILIIQDNFDVLWRSITDLKDNLNILSTRVKNG